MAPNSSTHILLCLAWTGGPPAIPGLSYQGSTTPRQADRYNTIPYISVVQAPLRLPTATTHKGPCQFQYHSPFTYLPRQISIYLNAIETKYVQVPSWPLYHTVLTMSQCRVCIQMQAEQANWCKLLLVATPQPGGRTLHRKACVLWLRPRSHCRSFVNSSGTTLWHYILLLDLSLSSILTIALTILGTTTLPQYDCSTAASTVLLFWYGWYGIWTIYNSILFSTFQILLHHDVHYFYDIRSMQRHPLSLASCTAPLYFLPKWFHPLVLVLQHTMRLLLLLLLPLLLLLLLLLLRLLLLTFLPTHLPTYLPTSYTIHYNNLNFFHHQDLTS